LQIEDDPHLLPNVSLVLKWDDTQGETVHATRTITQMICDKVAVFFGPEGNTCHTEAIVAQAWNIPMISYVSTLRNKRGQWRHYWANTLCGGIQ